MNLGCAVWGTLLYLGFSSALGQIGFKPQDRTVDKDQAGGNCTSYETSFATSECRAVVALSSEPFEA